MPAQAVAPLFNQKTLKNSLQSAKFPADFTDRHDIIKTWLNDLRSGKLNIVKEVSLHGQFLTDIFQRVLEMC